MRVKRLEVQGFKSFKDKTVLHFDHSITGIVGPNGCGKSNIVDAFFWVMGEQSNKHMRAGGSADLIFNGLSKYMPLGFAEAIMVLETDAADTQNAASGASAQDIPLHLRSKEIAVTRRVYRTGEGEYFINGVPARLRDIQELFMDTGIGAKGYSIIAQGEIQKIVNAKPDDRRLLIEEAAGIAKYKARKKESLRKMESAHGNLARLNDVITEIEKNLNSLERQAQKAAQYKKHKDDLLEREMTWGRRKNKVLGQRLVDLKSQRETLEQDLVGLRAELSTSENAIESDRTEQLTLTKQTEELQAIIQDMSGELTRTQSALDLSKRRQNDLTTQLETLEAEKLDLTSAISNEKEKIAGLEDEAQNAVEAYAASSARVTEKEEVVRSLRGEADSARKNLDQNKRDLMQGIAQASDLNSRAASLNSKIESASIQIEKLTAQASLLKEKIETAQIHVQTTEEKAVLARDLKSELSMKAKTVAQTVEASSQALNAARRILEETDRETTKFKSKLQSLEELAQAYEGFGDGPKAILDWAKNSGNDSGLKALADGLTVREGYEACLEGWLEGKLEDLTSDNTALALEALRELKNGNSGRASIHVAAMTNHHAVHFSDIQAALKNVGMNVEGKLSDFVTINSSIPESGQKAAQSTLSHVAVVDTFDGITQLLQNGMTALQGWGLVARDGSALDQDGTLRGGSIQSDNSASLLGRKRAIAELSDQVVASEAKRDQAQSDFDLKVENLNFSQTELVQIRSELQVAEISEATTAQETQQAQRALKDIQSQNELLDYELSEMNAEKSTAQNERAKIADELTAVASHKSTLEASIASSEITYSTQEEALRSAEEALSLLKIQDAGIKERAHSVKRELESGLSLIGDRERRLSDVERALNRASNENEEHSGGDTEFLVKIEELTRELATRRDLLAQSKNTLEIVSQKVGGVLDRIKELHTNGDHKTRQVNELSLEIERLNADLSHLMQNLEEKYGPGCLDLAAVSPIQEEMDAPIVTIEMSAEEEQILGEEVERLREKIRRLGDVNPNAVEEYEEKKKRFDHLTSEKGDLEKSIEDLMEAIEHINKTSEDRFRRAFEAIADRFERLFPIIFGGGQAKLSLVYPEGSTDILEAGVDILAQPPGKKIVNIGLLSGGEKALTAVSLIFAIFMVKPSPFCVLDEVDAPLDDANIGKFNALLREMSAKSQFIIITHNKKTMELNDTLYGVTMEEPGVSKMVSIEMH